MLYEVITVFVVAGVVDGGLDLQPHGGLQRQEFAAALHERELNDQGDEEDGGHDLRDDEGNLGHEVEQDDLDAKPVITSYSIHYTKLYDGDVHLQDLDALGGERMRPARGEKLGKQARLAVLAGRNRVITSYSIHYTKLYEWPWRKRLHPGWPW